MTGHLYILTRNGRELKPPRDVGMVMLDLVDDHAVAFTGTGCVGEIKRVFKVTISAVGLHLEGVHQPSPDRWEWCRWWFQVETE